LHCGLAQNWPTLSGSSIDDHRLWLRRLAIMAKSVVRCGGDLRACPRRDSLAVGRDPRHDGGQSESSKSCISSAPGTVIFRATPSAFFPAGPRGDAIGSGLAILTFLASGTLASFMQATPGGEQMEAMFGDFRWGSISMRQSR
jgi:cell division transport system permease protein